MAESSSEVKKSPRSGVFDNLNIDTTKICTDYERKFAFEAFDFVLRMNKDIEDMWKDQPCEPSSLTMFSNHIGYAILSWQFVMRDCLQGFLIKMNTLTPNAAMSYAIKMTKVIVDHQDSREQDPKARDPEKFLKCFAIVVEIYLYCSQRIRLNTITTKWAIVTWLAVYNTHFAKGFRGYRSSWAKLARIAKDKYAKWYSGKIKDFFDNTLAGHYLMFPAIEGEEILFHIGETKKALNKLLSKPECRDHNTLLDAGKAEAIKASKLLEKALSPIKKSSKHAILPRAPSLTQSSASYAAELKEILGEKLGGWADSHRHDKIYSSSYFEREDSTRRKRSKSCPTKKSRKSPSASAMSPSASAMSPSASAMSPSASVMSPSVSSMSPLASAMSPLASAMSPLASAMSPSASAMSPSASPSGSPMSPSASSMLPSASPSASAMSPSASPSASPTSPSASTSASPTSPSASTNLPSASRRLPSTSRAFQNLTEIMEKIDVKDSEDEP